MSAATVTLSIVIPCFNEQATLEKCVAAVLGIACDELRIELIIVDDASTDSSRRIAQSLADGDSRIQLFSHQVNRGKGAALRTGFQHATGDFVAIQDADLEYDPRDLVRLVEPLRQNEADVVLGSRYLTTHARRVLMFWHTKGNQFLTLLSNMMTDMNLTDMETCYKVFRRDIIQSIDLVEDRFGFEPEVVAKLADLRVRVYEMGISYRARTYAEGKKIGIRDGLRALFCIVRYNAGRVVWPLQIFFYAIIGALAGLINLALFQLLYSLSVPAWVAAGIAFASAAVVNYFLCVKTIFRRNVQWSTPLEILAYSLVVIVAGMVDNAAVSQFMDAGYSSAPSKVFATMMAFALNYVGRRYFVFREPLRGQWKRQVETSESSPMVGESTDE